VKVPGSFTALKRLIDRGSKWQGINNDLMRAVGVRSAGIVNAPTIEGLGHDGIAWRLRRSMTDFGSNFMQKLGGIGGWIGRALGEKGVIRPEGLETLKKRFTNFMERSGTIIDTKSQAAKASGGAHFEANYRNLDFVNRMHENVGLESAPLLVKGEHKIEVSKPALLRTASRMGVPIKTEEERMALYRFAGMHEILEGITGESTIVKGLMSGKTARQIKENLGKRSGGHYSLSVPGTEGILARILGVDVRRAQSQFRYGEINQNFHLLEKRLSQSSDLASTSRELYNAEKPWHGSVQKQLEQIHRQARQQRAIEDITLPKMFGSDEFQGSGRWDQIILQTDYRLKQIAASRERNIFSGLENLMDDSIGSQPLIPSPGLLMNNGSSQVRAHKMALAQRHGIAVTFGNVTSGHRSSSAYRASAPKKTGLRFPNNSTFKEKK
jgi:hypothetical protein